MTTLTMDRPVAAPAPAASASANPVATYLTALKGFIAVIERETRLLTDGEREQAADLVPEKQAAGLEMNEARRILIEDPSLLERLSPAEKTLIKAAEDRTRTVLMANRDALIVAVKVHRALIDVIVSAAKRVQARQEPAAYGASGQSAAARAPLSVKFDETL